MAGSVRGSPQWEVSFFGGNDVHHVTLTFEGLQESIHDAQSAAPRCSGYVDIEADLVSHKDELNAGSGALDQVTGRGNQWVGIAQRVGHGGAGCRLGWVRGHERHAGPAPPDIVDDDHRLNPLPQLGQRRPSRCGSRLQLGPVAPTGQRDL